MTEIPSPVDKLYDSDAAIYSAMSANRDFCAQASAISDLCALPSSGARLLELFAGPARHGMALEKQGLATVWALDSSSQMKALAINTTGFEEDRYFLCELPRIAESIKESAPFDAASVLLYSIGYLDLPAAYILLKELHKLLRPGGRIIFELHDLALSRSDFKDLQIRERHVRLDAQTDLACIWPASPLRWSDDDWSVDMDIEIKRIENNKIVSISRYISRERIYSASEIFFLGNLCGFKRVNLLNCLHVDFPGSNIIVMERS